jgi:serine/threonine-protein kinase OSR1/STK39
MPLMSQGSVQNVMSYNYSQGISDLSIIATILRDCVKALIYLHSKDLIHRDIKAANILIDDSGNFCLGDLGVAGFLKGGAKRTSFVGSLAWMAPEIFLADKGYDNKV